MKAEGTYATGDLSFRRIQEAEIRAELIVAQRHLTLNNDGRPYNNTAVAIPVDEEHPYRAELPCLPTHEQRESRLFYPGINHCADAIVVACGGIALIRKHNRDHWAFPGGFRDPGEGALQNAVREGKEEIGVDLEDLDPTLVWEGVVPAPFVRANRFTITSMYGFELYERQDLVVSDTAEIAEARWFSIDQAVSDRRLMIWGHRIVFDTLVTSGT